MSWMKKEKLIDVAGVDMTNMDFKNSDVGRGEAQPSI